MGTAEVMGCFLQLQLLSCHFSAVNLIRNILLLPEEKDGMEAAQRSQYSAGGT